MKRASGGPSPANAPARSTAPSKLPGVPKSMHPTGGAAEAASFRTQRDDHRTPLGRLRPCFKRPPGQGVRLGCPEPGARPLPANAKSASTCRAAIAGAFGKDS